MNTFNEDQKPTESVAIRRVPKCSKCRNHKIITPKKGHKGLCRFEVCDCPKCRITDERRAVMRSHIKMKRQLEKEDRKQKSVQLSSAGPSIPAANYEIAVTTLPPMHSYFGPQFYSFGTQSNISEASHQSWKSFITTSGEELNMTEDNNLQSSVV